MTVFVKDPDSTIDYAVNWGAGYLQDGESISQSEWLVSPAGELAVVDGSPSNTNTVATVFVSGGVIGKTYTLTNRVTTSGGRTDDRSLTIVVADR